MIQSRRSVLRSLVGMTAPAIVPYSNLMALSFTPMFDYTFAQDMDDVTRICNLRYNDKNDLEDFTDMLRIFRDEIEKKMTRWNTLKPWEQMKFVDLHTGEIRKIKNMFVDPNVFDECNFLGSWGKYDSTGFSASFEHPTNGKIVETRFHWSDKDWKFVEKDKRL